MKISFKLFASLGEYLPTGAERNRIEVDVPDGVTPAAIASQFGVPESKVHLVLVNGIYVAPAERDTLVLKEGDAVAMWPPIAGG